MNWPFHPLSAALTCMKRGVVRLCTLGVGAMNSPRFAPAGLLVEYAGRRVMIDGGPRAVPKGSLDAWLVTDERAELMREIRRFAEAKGICPYVGVFTSSGLRLEPHLVVHTSHAAYGFLIRALRKRIVWAPEFFEFPGWVEKADLMFAEASAWNRRIHFAGRVGGHASVLEVAASAQRKGVRRLIFAHIGRATIKAMDAGNVPPFGEFGKDNAIYLLGGRSLQ